MSDVRFYKRGKHGNAEFLCQIGGMSKPQRGDLIELDGKLYEAQIVYTRIANDAAAVVAVVAESCLQSVENSK
jgi:hypothetical protein